MKLEKWKGDSTVVINDNDFAIGCRVDVNPLDLQEAVTAEVNKTDLSGSEFTDERSDRHDQIVKGAGW